MVSVGAFGRLSGSEVQAGLGLRRGANHQGGDAKSCNGFSVPRLLASHPEPGQLLHQDILCAPHVEGHGGGTVGQGRGGDIS